MSLYFQNRLLATIICNTCSSCTPFDWFIDSLILCFHKHNGCIVFCSARCTLHILREPHYIGEFMQKRIQPMYMVIMHRNLHLWTQFAREKYPHGVVCCEQTLKVHPCVICNLFGIAIAFIAVCPDLNYSIRQVDGWALCLYAVGILSPWELRYYSLMSGCSEKWYHDHPGIWMASKGKGLRYVTSSKRRYFTNVP